MRRRSEAKKRFEIAVAEDDAAQRALDAFRAEMGGCMDMEDFLDLVRKQRKR